MKDMYIYPAIFSYVDDNDYDDDISVEFPNLDGAYTCGTTPKEAYSMAKDCLESHLYEMEEDGDTIPEPSNKNDIKLEENQTIQMIKVNMNHIRD